MSVPRMNADQATGFQLACDAMALEGVIMQDATHPDHCAMTPTQAYQQAGKHMVEFAGHLAATADNPDAQTGT